MACPARMRLLGLAGAVCYGLLALGSAADRLAPTNSGLAARVPAVFSDQSLRTLGRDQLAGGDAAAALRSAQAALRAAPLDPASTALLGAARAASHDPAGAERAFRVAGQLGWRVPYTQAYWLDRALSASDYAAAALRLDALLRGQPALAAQRALFDPFERNPAGQHALVMRMRLRPAWLDRYAAEAADLPANALDQRTAVLAELARMQTPVGCKAIGPAVTRLVALDRIAPAARLWQQHCPQPRSGMLGDGSFAALRPDQVPSPFAWAMTASADVALALVPGGDNCARQLTIESSASVTRRIAAQLTPATPGRYRLSWHAGGSASALRVAASCTIEPALWQTGVWDARSQRWRAEVSLASDCPAHWIVIGIAPGAGRTWLGQLSLDPAGG